ncbi:tRNA pseudouridine(38-40) synthase TruA [Halobacillus litoralis]|uniref:tRNA pseudouridine(38-40) synthase TruA n=1 Tax=Halobacillus litoralis TaxID=45668 RepID=UPI001CD62401|nr:tRNA pseudouridine(38-40) synthase TruA [Halobacillus litoralis]MCA0972624.1 tRNA pseudouridine(38-40) synthase TruA [Halobacillus litoralis]
MERLRCIIQYDGTHYAGYQVQPNGNTVQAELEKALKKMHKGEGIRVVASGRTDSGVHAKGQVIHFDTTLRIPASNWRRALSSLLPDDIKVEDVEVVSPDFHARYDTTGKEYRYFVWNAQEEDIFKRLYHHHVRDTLDLAAMREACAYLEGEHDFTSFCSPKTDIKGDKVRTIYQADVIQEEERITFVFRGSGFLYNMVRILTGTLLEVGRGERKASEIPGMIEARNRDAAGKTAPARGLFLWEVYYT